MDPARAKVAESNGSGLWGMSSVPAVSPLPQQEHVAILVPMDVEVRPVVSALPVRRLHDAPTAAWAGRLEGTDITVHMIGIGPAHATEVTERVVEDHRPDRLVVCGIAGGLGKSTEIGQLLVPAEVIDATTGERFGSHRWGPLVPTGSLVTTEGMWGADRLAPHIDAGVEAVDMETSAVAAVAERSSLPWTAFRGISDLVREGVVDESTLDLTRPDGTADVGAALRFMALAPWRVPRLFKVALDMRRATHVATAAVLAALDEPVG